MVTRSPRSTNHKARNVRLLFGYSRYITPSSLVSLFFIIGNAAVAEMCICHPIHFFLTETDRTRQPLPLTSHPLCRHLRACQLINFLLYFPILESKKSGQDNVSILSIEKRPGDAYNGTQGETRDTPTTLAAFSAAIKEASEKDGLFLSFSYSFSFSCSSHHLSLRLFFSSPFIYHHCKRLLRMTVLNNTGTGSDGHDYNKIIEIGDGLIMRWSTKADSDNVAELVGDSFRVSLF